MPPVIASLSPMTFCEALLVALDLHGGKDFQMGLTKVFFRAGKLQFLDELTSSSQDTLSTIAGKVKKWLARYFSL
jgi:myosin heavy subunit